MKKLMLLFLVILFLFSYNIENDDVVFSYVNEEVFDNYNIYFKECDLNTNNFIEKFSYLKQYDFKILEIVPYHNFEKKYLFYTNNLEYIIDKFKNDYIDSMVGESKYTTNVCINQVKINTSNVILEEYKRVIDFTY